MTATPTEAERELAADLIDRINDMGPAMAYRTVAQALADQRARYEAVAAAQDESAVRWTEAVDEADNDLDRGYATGREHAAEQAALRIRQVAR